MLYICMSNKLGKVIQSEFKLSIPWEKTAVLDLKILQAKYIKQAFDKLSFLLLFLLHTLRIASRVIGKKRKCEKIISSR